MGVDHYPGWCRLLFSGSELEYGSLTADGKTLALYTTFTLRNGTYEYQNTGDMRAPLMNEAQRGAYIKGNMIDNNTYENDWMGIRFTAPDGFRLLTEEELEAYSEDVEARAAEDNTAAEEDSAALGVENTDVLTDEEVEMFCASTTSISYVIISAGQLLDPSITRDQYIEVLKQDFQETLNAEMNPSVEDIVIAGHEFTKLQGTATIDVDGNEIIQYCDLYCTRVDDIIYEILVGDDEESSEAAGLINSFEIKD